MVEIPRWTTGRHYYGRVCREFSRVIYIMRGLIAPSQSGTATDSIKELRLPVLRHQHAVWFTDRLRLLDYHQNHRDPDTCMAA